MLSYGNAFLGQLGSGVLGVGKRCEDQGETADPTEKHKPDQDKAGDQPERWGDSHGQPHGSDGGSGFKETGEDGKSLCPADDESAAKEQNQVHDQDGGRLRYRFGGYTPVEEGGVFFAAEDSQRIGKQNCQCGCFHAACGGSGGPSDHHQEEDQDPTGFA